jgi:hypothetical protein
MSEFVFIGGEDVKESGIFFRLPIQNTLYDWYGNDGSPMYPQGINKILNIFRIKKAKEHAKHDNAGGFNFIEFCTPIFFNRMGRKNIAIRKKDILSITSNGYEGYKNSCSGQCVKETTIITYLENGKVKNFKVVETESYKFTYTHILSKLLD